MRIVQSLAIAAVLGTAALAAPSAQASDFGVSVNVGNSYYGDGYYESVWVPPVYRTEYYYGQPRLVIVVPGYYSRVYRPRYSHYGHNHSYYGNNYYSGRGSSYYGGSYNRGNDHRGHDHARRDNTRNDHRGHDHNRNDRNDRRR